MAEGVTTIGIIGNCQAGAIGEAMQVMNRKLRITTVSAYGLLAADQRARLVEQLGAMDIVLVSVLSRNFGQFAVDRVKDTFKHARLLPSVFFTGFHPDQVYLPNAYSNVLSPTVHLHSRIVLAGFLTGRSVEQTVSLFNALVYDRLGYFAMYEEQFALLAWSMKSGGFDLTREMDAWRGSGCFMHSVNHPKAHVIADLAADTLRRVGLKVVDRRGAERMTDDLAGSIHFPVYPEIAEEHGIQGSLLFQTLHGAMPIDDYVRASYAAYAHVPREGLPAAGVDAAVANVLAS